MAFQLGAHKIDEILWGVSEDFNGNLLYALSELSNASIEITAESSDFTDKKGNVIRTIYRSKSGTLNATHAMLHPAAMNAGSGSDIMVASEINPIQMPKIVTVSAGGELDISDAIEGTIKVIGLYNSGANGAVLTQDTTAVVDKSFAIVSNKLTVPAAADGAPINYLVKYEKNEKSGIAMVNNATKFPVAQKLTLMCSYVDPCSSDLRSCFVVCPSFVPDPNMTINLDAENQELDFNGNLNIEYCSGADNKILYYIFYPGTNEVVTGTVDPGTNNTTVDNP